MARAQVGGMTSITTLGHVWYSRPAMLEKLDEFAALYAERPIQDNTGGMQSPHLFLLWYALQELRPKAIVESGVWMGQGTWLMERVCPEAQLYCIDPNLDRIRYRSGRARYFDRDFSTIDWSDLPPESTVLFFDDHQNAYERVKTAKWFGFKHLIFEDNYPPSQGDCYSLKKAFLHSGFRFTPAPTRSVEAKLKGVARKMLRRNQAVPAEVPPNAVDAEYLRKNLETYFELPPILKPSHTRWGDPWDGMKYPTPDPLLAVAGIETPPCYVAEARAYTWMCYARLR